MSDLPLSFQNINIILPSLAASSLQDANSLALSIRHRSFMLQKLSNAGISRLFRTETTIEQMRIYQEDVSERLSLSYVSSVYKDESLLLRDMLVAVDSRDKDAFAHIMDTTDWKEYRPELFAYAVKLAHNQEWFALASKLAQQGITLFPESEELQKLNRIFAPPRVHITSTEPLRGLSASRAWIRDNARLYHGRWVAVYDGQLLAVADSLQELRERVGQLEHPASTIMTYVL